MAFWDSSRSLFVHVLSSLPFVHSQHICVLFTAGRSLFSLLALSPFSLSPSSSFCGSLVVLSVLALDHYVSPFLQMHVILHFHSLHCILVFFHTLFVCRYLCSSRCVHCLVCFFALMWVVSAPHILTTFHADLSRLPSQPLFCSNTSILHLSRFSLMIDFLFLFCPVLAFEFSN